MRACRAALSTSVCPASGPRGSAFINARFYRIGSNEPPLQPDVLLNPERDFALPFGCRLLVGAYANVGVPVGWGPRLKGGYLSGATSLGKATVGLLWPLAKA